ncbi:MAG: carboxypeptidase-like regulatory domain-containing protein, partial [Alistipes sp.]|nr:carboxypeptidase-like regulatory domain-containing protein [Alistipes sp.]
MLGGGILLSSAQNTQISGRVTGIDGTPVAGATVVVEGPTLGTTTGADGKFALAAPAESTLSISFIGYRPAQV